MGILLTSFPASPYAKVENPIHYAGEFLDKIHFRETPIAS